jgi:hypothetical protein
MNQIKSNVLTKIISHKQTSDAPVKINILNFLVGSALINKNEQKLWEFSRKISKHFIGEFLQTKIVDVESRIE